MPSLKSMVKQEVLERAMGYRCYYKNQRCVHVVKSLSIYENSIPCSSGCQW